MKKNFIVGIAIVLISCTLCACGASKVSVTLVNKTPTEIERIEINEKVQKGIGIIPKGGTTKISLTDGKTYNFTLTGADKHEYVKHDEIAVKNKEIVFSNADFSSKDFKDSVKKFFGK